MQMTRDISVYFDIFLLKQVDSSCLDRYDFRAKFLPQLLHENGFRLEWVCVCALKLLLSANLLLQMLHEKGFSPVCVRIWPWRSQGLENTLPQKLQAQPPEWVRSCMLRAAELLYTLSHCEQLNLLLLWVVIMWRWRLEVVLNVLLQTRQDKEGEELNWNKVFIERSKGSICGGTSSNSRDILGGSVIGGETEAVLRQGEDLDESKSSWSWLSMLMSGFTSSEAVWNLMWSIIEAWWRERRCRRHFIKSNSIINRFSSTVF